ncbi:MAG: haloalkane dehalogenase [Halioglobus sp.]
MKVLRTPDDNFTQLADFPYAPHYVEVPDGEGGELRVHYVDEGSPDGPVVLLMHGQPTWSYLYRYMIPLLVEEGFRVIAPDLVGFGRSDKPALQADYTYARHVSWMSHWLQALDLQGVTLFCQDWGGLIGLRLVAAFPDRFSHVVVANTGLPTGFIPEEFSAPLQQAYLTLPVVPAQELGARFKDTSGIPGFLYWRKFAAESAEFEVGSFMGVSSPNLTAAEELAYSAPFPDQDYMSGARQFPSLVPVFPDEAEVAENKAAWEVLAQFEKPFLTAFSDSDPVTAGGDKAFLERVPGCQGMPHRTIEGAGHFLQQEQPQACVQAILDVRSA